MIDACTFRIQVPSNTKGKLTLSSLAIGSQQTKHAKSCNPEPCKEESSAHIDILVTAVTVAALTRKLEVEFRILGFWQFRALMFLRVVTTSTVTDVRRL